MTENARAPRRALVTWLLAATAVILAVLATAWVLAHRSAPLPQFATDSGIHVRTSAAIPPEPLAPSQVHLSIGGVTGSTVRVYLEDYDSGGEVEAVVSTGETVQLGDVVVRVCATWEDKTFVPPWDTPVGGGDDKLYYVYSTDGSTPECPERRA